MTRFALQAAHRVLRTTTTRPRRLVFLAACVSLCFIALPCFATASESVDREAAADTSLQFVVEVGSRLYPDWKETVHVRMEERFFLADTDMEARVVRFVPDFRILKGGEIISRSEQLSNPAVHVVVEGDSAQSEGGWVFLNFPPHFAPESFFTFKLKEVHGYTPPEPDRDAALKKEDDDG